MSEQNLEDQNIVPGRPRNTGLALDINEDPEVFIEFLSEFNDHLEESEGNVLDLEKGNNTKELIDSIFRNIHSIKGDAGFIGLADVEELGHELETLLDKLRKEEIAVSCGITSICLDSIDVLRELMNNFSIKVENALGRAKGTDASIEERTVDIQPLIERIHTILHSAA